MRSRTAPLTLLALLALTSSVDAQTITLRTLGSRASEDVKLPIGAADCADNIQFTFRVEGLADGNTLAVFYGSDCATGENRSVSTTGTQKCFLVASKDWQGAGVEISFGAKDLKCDETAALDVDRNLFFLTLPSATDATTVTGTNIVAYSPAIQLDSKPPSAPTNVRGGSGETSIPVSWSAVNDDLREFIVYWAPTESASCATTLMTPGQAVNPNGLELKDEISPTSSSTILRTPLAVGERAAVGVIAIDLAGNESPLSNLDCIEGIETTSWIDLHKAEGGKTGNTCSVAEMTRGHVSALALWSMLMLFLGRRAVRRVS